MPVVNSKTVSRILIVDDEKPLVGALQQILSYDFPEVQIDAAFSGEEALSRLADTSYDLIIADLRMPGFDGLDLVKGVRYMEPDVPIVLMTAFGSDVVKGQASELGVKYYLDKPFDVDEILQAVGACLPGREQGDG
jgi:two-component system response regulator (stage 0 sporulation protein F)